mgnify:FL=1
MKKKLCFDLDGVICTTKKNFYKKSRPKKKIIENINQLYKKNYIIIFTSRFMGRTNENVNLAKKKGYKFTLNQLNKWGLKFHKLVFGKPSYDVIVDDKCFYFKKNWINDFKRKYK